MKRILIVASLLLIILAGAFLKKSEKNNFESTIVLGLPFAWGEVIPPIQHTVYGDVIIGNIFEPLVTLNDKGIIEPLAAVSWEVSKDLKSIVFKIDTQRRYSNGEYLQARHFKDSWENGLRMTPKSSKSSLADALYLIEGMEKFYEKGSLQGVEVIDKETLKVTFSRPVRMGIEFLAGGRTAAYLHMDGKYFGTGPYKIQRELDNQIHLARNSFSQNTSGSDNVKIINLADRGLSDQDVDVYFAMGSDDLPKSMKDKPIEVLNGFEYSHIVLSLNGLENSTFGQIGNRQALQSIIHNALFDKAEADKFKNLRIDPLVFLPFQPGYISTSETKSILNFGQKYSRLLISKTKTSPIRFIYPAPEWGILQEILENIGIEFTNDSGLKPFSEIVASFYKKHDADMIGHSASVLNGDPDGIYHLLGKNGAITSPMIQRPRVAELLEEGRKIMKHEELNAPYQEVSRAILEEVPFVHFGFSYAKIFYNPETVETDAGTVQREMHEFAQFRKK